MRATIKVSGGILPFLCFMFLFVSVVFGSDAAKKSAHSVVSITAKGTKTATGTGFIWKENTYVVTALHVVAGAKQIKVYSQSKKDETEADIVAVHLESDLALLKLKNDLGLAPLSHAPTDPNSTDQFYIVGYPLDVAKMEGRPLRFSWGLENTQPTLGSIFKNRQKLQEVIGSQGYPSFDAKIFRVASNIQHGHSGAPIINKNGQVIGIGDGGLRDGTAGINWAIPAMIYLPGLESSKDPIPSGPSVQSGLMSYSGEGTVKISYGASQPSTPSYTPPEEQNVEPSEAEEKWEDFEWEETYSEQFLYKVWEAPMSEIIFTSDDELVEIFNLMNEMAKEETGRSLDDAIIEVYEDYVTGATVAVPRGIVMDYDDSSHTLMAAAGGEETDIYMVVQILINDSWQEAMNKLYEFDGELNTLNYWQEDPDPAFADDEEIDESESFAYISKYRWVPDEENNPTSEMNATMRIDMNDFLGTAVIANNVPQFTPDEWYHWYLMSMCVELANFPTH